MVEGKIGVLRDSYREERRGVRKEVGERGTLCEFHPWDGFHRLTNSWLIVLVHPSGLRTHRSGFFGVADGVSHQLFFVYCYKEQYGVLHPIHSKRTPRNGFHQLVRIRRNTELNLICGVSNYDESMLNYKLFLLVREYPWILNYK